MADIASVPIVQPTPSFVADVPFTSIFANPAFLAASVENDVLSSSGLLSTTTPAATQNDAFLNEGLLSTNTETLSLLNGIGSEFVTGQIPADLTSQQLHDLGILKEDVLKLEEAATLSATLPLTAGTTTVDLSAEAQVLANALVGVNNVTNANGAVAAAANVPVPLTPQQVQQAAAILAPLANQPLSAALLAQIQTQLATQISPLQFNLNTLFFVMSYIAAMQPASVNAVHTEHEEIVANTDEDVAPVASTDKVAEEDSAILGS